MTGPPPSWVRDAGFYQIFPDRFATSARVPKPGPMEDWDAPPTVHGFKGGDLGGVAERLDYLADLGISAIYLNPIFASAANHRYHTYDYLQVDPLLGGEAAFRELLDAAHGRGLRVVID
ncbi:MAG: alpha-amylase family glycosyl hydrolase, partial [Candidatus Limnocylindria bacterium]